MLSPSSNESTAMTPPIPTIDSMPTPTATTTARPEPGGRIDLSVLIPVYNEVDNVVPLHAELDAILGDGPWSYELIFVNDGSTDGTAARLEAIQRADPGRVRVAFLRRNCGQTAALSAALDLARGDVLIPMDGDRQNDPADIPRLLKALDGGYDVVSGWRKDRHDTFLTRKVPSWIANRLVARLSGVPLHDFGCTLKAYRRRVLEGVRLYGEMHRFIPIFAAWHGARVTELVVNHRPRTAGRTKYGLGRTFNVVLDLILIRFLQRYSQRPLHFFGRFGLWSFGLSIVCFVAMLYFKCVFPWPYLWWGRDLPAKTFVETPLPQLTAIFAVSGIMSILMGILAEVIMRTYYEAQHKTTYLLGEVRQGAPTDREDDRDGEAAGRPAAGDSTPTDRPVT
jgi:glycosyltransferase involved in cell wall biosynthesis